MPVAGQEHIAMPMQSNIFSQVFPPEAMPQSQEEHHSLLFVLFCCKLFGAKPYNAQLHRIRTQQETLQIFQFSVWLDLSGISLPDGREMTYMPRYGLFIIWLQKTLLWPNAILSALVTVNTTYICSLANWLARTGLSLSISDCKLRIN